MQDVDAGTGVAVGDTLHGQTVHAIGADGLPYNNNGDPILPPAMAASLDLPVSGALGAGALPPNLNPNAMVVTDDHLQNVNN